MMCGTFMSYLRTILNSSSLVHHGFLILLLCLAPSGISAQTSVLTQHNDNARTGQNTNETILKTSNVNASQFGKLFAMAVDGQVYAQPLYVPNVSIAGGTHNVVIIATENDSVYAFDADSGGAPLWKASMVDALHGAGSGETPLNNSTTIDCEDMQSTIGITSTPVIDPASNTIYVEAKSTDGLNYFHRLHALNLLTGSEKSPGPVQVTATVTGTGDGSTNGQLVFESATMSLHHNARAGLLLMSGTIYIAFTSHCDAAPYHGWLFAYDAATFARKSVYVTTPNGGLGSFWMSGAGVAADSGGNIYIASGNGDFDTVNVPARELGDSLLKLGTTNQTLSLLDYFTPQDQQSLENSDQDLGSGGVLLLPDQPGSFPHILVQAGKEGQVYVVNRDQFTTGNSHYCANCGNDPEIIEESSSGAVGGIWGAPAYWNNNIYFGGSGDDLKVIPITNGLPDFTRMSSSSTSIGYPGITPSISSNGTAAGTAILWAIDSSQFGSPGPGPGPAVLHAFDATNIVNELWNTTQAANNRDRAGNAVKFAVPTIANGKVYIGTLSEVDVYGLLTSGAPAITSANSTTFTVGTAGSFAVTTTGTPTPTVSETGTLPSGVTFVNNGNGTATLGGTPAAGTAGSYPITITASNGVGTAATQSFTLTVNQAPAITSLSPTSGVVGGSVTIAGTSFGATQGSSTVKFNGTVALTTGWSNTQIQATVPTGATTGPVLVTVNGAASNALTFTVNTGSNGYSHNRAITINHTQVPNTDQTNFPLLVSGTYSYLATTANGGNVTSANGYDIVFTSDAGGTNALAFERESYNATTGAVNFWIKIPTLSHTTDTVIYMFYGNSSVTTDPSNKTAVWDSNYLGVWHLGETSGTAIGDSTANGHNGTKLGSNTPAATSGKVDGAQSFNPSTNDYIDVASFAPPTSLTIEAWINTPGNSGINNIILNKNNSEYDFRIQGNGNLGGIAGGTSLTDSAFNFFAAGNINQWFHVVFTFDAAGQLNKLYRNGALTQSGANTGSITATSNDMWIGRHSQYNFGTFKGTIDEVRISSIARSANWIATEYNNQSNPSNFYTVTP
jgi:Concanavalin A-like lectin/glucanases superfamily/IPT/TIG domain/Domain of unknown function (DUF2341)/Putative Ig domain